ncbi:MAG: DUF1223 domain-containing protein [Opitutaceae bacterium]
MVSVLFLTALPIYLRAETTFRSGPAQVALVELYTSEGCSSCPPAEKWLGELTRDPGLWQRFVPVAFHVNYWDRLGWRDKLATQAFTQREYAYAEAWRAANVYTPCFVRNGAEWRPREGGLTDRTADAPAAGEIAVSRQTDGKWRVEYMPAPTPGAAMGKNASREFDMSVALLGSGMVSAVKAGENSGRELRHEFVALNLATVPLVRGADGNFSAVVSLALAPGRDLPAIPRRAIAAWVTRHGELTPLQATGSWLE